MLLSKQWRHRSILLKILNLSSLSRVPICQQFPCAPWTQLLSIFADVSCEWDLPDIWKDFQFFFSESSCHLLSTLNQDASTGTLHPLKLSIQPAAVLHQCFISSLVFRTFFKSFVNLCILWILHIVTGDLRILQLSCNQWWYIADCSFTLERRLRMTVTMFSRALKRIF